MTTDASTDCDQPVEPSIGAMNDLVDGKTGVVGLSVPGRALRAGKRPRTPALHCAITRPALPMMNSGAAMAIADVQGLGGCSWIISPPIKGIVPHLIAVGSFSVSGVT